MSDFSNVIKALEDLHQGRMVVLFDDENRENEGDLILAAEKTTPAAINFMITEGRGLVCLALHEQYIERLQIPMMVQRNNADKTAAYTVSIEAARGVTTGISAADRAHTILTAINPNSTMNDIALPGHIFPLRARKHGVLDRVGHTEGGVDLARLAGLAPAAVICECLNSDGSSARLPQLKEFAAKHNLTLLSIRELVDYRLQQETIVENIASARLPLEPHGEFVLNIFADILNGDHHLALIHGKLPKDKPILVRLHSECLTGDLFGSCRCDCGGQLQQSLQRISEENGVLLYLRQEGRGIGLANKIKAYSLQDQGLDTIEANHQLGFSADERNYQIGAQILKQLGIKQIRLLTNNPQKVAELTRYGIEIIQRESIMTTPNQENTRYLNTKKNKLGHLLNV